MAVVALALPGLAAVEFSVHRIDPEGGLRLVDRDGVEVVLWHRPIASLGDVDHFQFDRIGDEVALVTTLRADVVQRVAEETAALVGQPIAVVVDGEVVSQAKLVMPWEREMATTGRFSPALVERLNAARAADP